jgi:hypothetical protein
MRLPLSKDCAMRIRDHISRLQEGHDSFQEIWENTSHETGYRRHSLRRSDTFLAKVKLESFFP